MRKWMAALAAPLLLGGLAAASPAHAEEVDVVPESAPTLIYEVAAPTFVDECGVDKDDLIVPADTEQVYYDFIEVTAGGHLLNDATVWAYPQEGYAFAPELLAEFLHEAVFWDHSYTDEVEQPCPVEPAPVVPAPVEPEPVEEPCPEPGVSFEDRVNPPAQTSALAVKPVTNPMAPAPVPTVTVPNSPLLPTPMTEVVALTDDRPTVDVLADTVDRNLRASLIVAIGIGVLVALLLIGIAVSKVLTRTEPRHRA